MLAGLLPRIRCIGRVVRSLHLRKDVSFNMAQIIRRLLWNETPCKILLDAVRISANLLWQPFFPYVTT